MAVMDWIVDRGSVKKSDTIPRPHRPSPDIPSRISRLPGSARRGPSWSCLPRSRGDAVDRQTCRLDRASGLAIGRATPSWSNAEYSRDMHLWLWNSGC